MTFAEITEMATTVKENLLTDPDWAKMEAGLMMATSFNEPKLNSVLLEGCSIDNNGVVILNSFMKENPEYGEYIFFNLFLLTPQDSNLHDSLIHKNVNKLIINRYRKDEFPDDLTPLINLESLTLDLDYSGIPDPIYKLITLKCLDINPKNTDFIPDQIFKLKNINSLTIRQPIMELPSKFTSIQNLRYLDIDISSLKTVAKEFLKIDYLETLVLHSKRNMIPMILDDMLKLNYERVSNNKINISFHHI